jgi:hypothetical protein
VKPPLLNCWSKLRALGLAAVFGDQFLGQSSVSLCHSQFRYPRHGNPKTSPSPSHAPCIYSMESTKEALASPKVQLAFAGAGAFYLLTRVIRLLLAFLNVFVLSGTNVSDARPCA